MPLAISAHEARVETARTKEADKAYDAVKAALNAAFSHIRLATERNLSRTLFTVMPEVHGFSATHGAAAAREVAATLRRRGFRVTAMSAQDLLISWKAEEAEPRRPGRGGHTTDIAPEDAWRFGRGRGG